MIILAATTLIASFTMPVKPVVDMLSWRDGAVVRMTSDDVPSNKRPTRFREVVQGVQYDGDYSPDSARDPEPAASPTTPVRYLPWWKRQIPVRVKPAPRYVDPAPAQGQNAQQDASQQQTQQNYGANSAATYSPPPAPVDSDIVTSGGASAVGSGSATGSNAVATYGELPAPAATVSAPPGSTIIQVGQPRG